MSTDRRSVREVFAQKGDFAASRAAESYLRARGFSVGPLERGSPRGVMLNSRDTEWVVAKWHNLSPAERTACHGEITGDARHGPITVRVWTDNAEAATTFLGAPTE